MVAAGTTLQLFQAALMQQAFGAYVAVLAAEKGWSKTALSGGAALQSIAAAGGVAERIHLLGYRPYAELPAIFAQSAGLLFASLNEGFGLPIIEAMAMEVPVLTSTVTSCPETAGGHAVLVDPMSVEELREYIAILKAEIARVEEKVKAKQSHASAAASFFKK